MFGGEAAGVEVGVMATHRSKDSRGNRGKVRKYSAEEKQKALKLAGEIGTAEAAQRMKIPRGTVRFWVDLSKQKASETQSESLVADSNAAAGMPRPT